MGLGRELLLVLLEGTNGQAATDGVLVRERDATTALRRLSASAQRVIAVGQRQHPWGINTELRFWKSWERSTSVPSIEVCCVWSQRNLLQRHGDSEGIFHQK